MLTRAAPPIGSRRRRGCITRASFPLDIEVCTPVLVGRGQARRGGRNEACAVVRGAVCPRKHAFFFCKTGVLDYMAIPVAAGPLGTLLQLQT